MFFDALADSDNLEIFNITIIHIIINKAWVELRLFFFWFLMFPYLLLLISYSFWQNFVIVELDKQILFKSVDQQQKIGNVVCILILLNCFVILAQEGYQFKQDYKRYLSSVWNFVDLCPLGFASFGPILQLLGYKLNPWQLEPGEEQNEVLRGARKISQAIASMLLYIKLLYYLRTH